MKPIRITLLTILITLPGLAQATIIGYDIEFGFDNPNYQQGDTPGGITKSKITIDLEARALTSFNGTFTSIGESELEFELVWVGFSPISTVFEPLLSYPTSSTFFTNFGLIEFDSGAKWYLQLEQVISPGAEPLLSIDHLEGGAGSFFSSSDKEFWTQVGSVSEPYVIQVHEPATLSILTLGLIGIGLRRRFKNRWILFYCQLRG